MILNQILKVARGMEEDGIVYKDISNSYEAMCEDD